MKFNIIHHCALAWTFFSLTTLFAEQIHKKVLIMTSVANHADFIEIQSKSFKKFLEDDYEYIVFNDAFEENEAKEISNICSLLKINCTRIPQEDRGTPDWLVRKHPQFVSEHPWWAFAAFRHDQAISYMMKTAGFNCDGIVVMIDADMFLTDNFSVVDFLGDYDIAGVRLGYEPNLIHFWPGLMFFRMDRLPNKETMEFTPVVTEALTLNTGGSLYHYLEANQNIKKLFFKQEGRLLLDKELNPFYVVAAGNHRTIQCQSCLGTEKKCSHNIQILKELGFRANIVELIEQRNCPGNCEFVLNDTFFHFREGSNSPTMAHHDDIDSRELNEKLRRFHAFMYEILDC